MILIEKVEVLRGSFKYKAPDTGLNELPHELLIWIKFKAKHITLHSMRNTDAGCS